MNKYICIGRIGYPPDEITGGCKITLAVDTFDGREKKAIWLKVLIFGASGQNVLKHKNKGDRILIEGRLDRNINDELIIVSDNVEFL